MAKASKGTTKPVKPREVVVIIQSNTFTDNKGLGKPTTTKEKKSNNNS